jgi:hypothetical protein
VDRKKAKIIKEAFELYAQNKSLEDICDFLAQNGITIEVAEKNPQRRGRKYPLTNPFYYGHFRYAKELHEASTSQSSQRNFLIKCKKF